MLNSRLLKLIIIILEITGNYEGNSQYGHSSTCVHYFSNFL